MRYSTDDELVLTFTPPGIDVTWKLHQEWVKEDANRRKYNIKLQVQNKGKKISREVLLIATLTVLKGCRGQICTWDYNEILYQLQLRVAGVA